MTRCYHSFNLSNSDRPIFACDWIDRGHFYVDLSWGNGNSDPVWQIGAEVAVPEIVSRLADRWYARRLRSGTP